LLKHFDANLEGEKEIFQDKPVCAQSIVPHTNYCDILMLIKKKKEERYQDNLVCAQSLAPHTNCRDILMPI
jgi:hypothetical protein